MVGLIQTDRWTDFIESKLGYYSVQCVHSMIFYILRCCWNVARCCCYYSVLCWLYPVADICHEFFLFSAGFKLRRRRITNQPTGGSGNCPHLVEALPCDDPSCYYWQLVSLDQCVPGDGRTCGPGAQLAQVQCVNSSGEEKKMKSLSELRGFSYTSLLLPHEKSGMVENIYNTDKNRVVCFSYKPKIKLRVLWVTSISIVSWIIQSLEMFWSSPQNNREYAKSLLNKIQRIFLVFLKNYRFLFYFSGV